MNQKLVSIITPCYNGEKFVSRYLDSVLRQTYNNIELIVINDGSTDGTEKILEKYEKVFEKNNIKYTHLYQENKGQAAAINLGLQIFNGDYLTWPDSDDVLKEESIEEKVRFLEDNKECSFVLTGADVIDEKTGKKIKQYRRKNKNKIQDSFEDLIFVNDIWYAPGCYMVRTTDFLKAIPTKKIYESRGGQNWQMLLPIAYNNKMGYIDKSLFDYYVRENSHSRIKGFEGQIHKIEGYEDILKNVLEGMNLYQKYCGKISLLYKKRKLNVAYYYKNKEYFNSLYKEMRKNKIGLKLYIKFLLINIR